MSRDPLPLSPRVKTSQFVADHEFKGMPKVVLFLIPELISDMNRD